MALAVKNPPVNAGDIRDKGSITELGRSPGEGNGNPLQYSCLENPMDRGAWRAMLHLVTKRQTQLKRLSMRASTQELNRGLHLKMMLFSLTDWQELPFTGSIFPQECLGLPYFLMDLCLQKTPLSVTQPSNVSLS